MKRKNTKRREKPCDAAGAKSNSVVLPSVATRTWLSLWLSVHLLALLVSYTSVVEPSGVQSQLAQLVHPYLRPTHFGADDRPVYLTHADALEQPHRLQVTTTDGDIESIDENQWRNVGPLEDEADVTPGMAVSDRVARWLATVAMLAENEQPSLVAELLLPIATSDPEVTAIRVMRLPTDLSEINEQPQPQYVARVVRAGDLISLVQLQPSRLSSTSILPASSSLPEEQSSREDRSSAEESVDE